MKSPRGLSPEEAAAWARLARSVEPLEGRRHAKQVEDPAAMGKAVPAPRSANASPRTASAPAPPVRRQPAPLSRTGGENQTGGLDSSWEKKLRGARLAPDFTLDLHGASLDAAHERLDRGLTQARAMGARLVLLVTGKPRPAEAADRGERRGAIRAKVLDWLAAGPHAGAIAAVRPAHRRHGGAGALYIVMRRAR